MLLRLLLGGRDSRGRLVYAGDVAKWHKAAGDWVAFGEELCDVLIQEVTSPAWIHAARYRRRRLSANPDELAAAVADEITTAPLGAGDGDVPSPDRAESVTEDTWFVLQVVSSDEGYLRQIWAHEGQRIRAGEVLALLSTDLVEGIDVAASDLVAIPVFRTVGNSIE